MRQIPVRFADEIMQVETVLSAQTSVRNRIRPPRLSERSGALICTGGMSWPGRV